MDILKWNELLIKYPKACVILYFWLLNKSEVEGYKLEQSSLKNILTTKNILGNEEKIFVFFDEKRILCGAFPLKHNKFRCFAQSEYRTFICNDQPNRESCTEMIVTNGLHLLQERINKNSDG